MAWKQGRKCVQMRASCGQALAPAGTGGQEPSGWTIFKPRVPRSGRP